MPGVSGPQWCRSSRPCFQGHSFPPPGGASEIVHVLRHVPAPHLHVRLGYTSDLHSSPDTLGCIECQVRAEIFFLDTTFAKVLESILTLARLEVVTVTARRAKGAHVGYLRVSTVDQNEHRQLEGIDLDKVYTDKASGKDTKRPQLQAALEYVREGDTLVIHSMDRLARNLDDLRKIVRELVSRGVHVQFIKESLTFTGDDSPMATLLLSVMGAFAEFERALIRERQREGIALAKAAGAYKGRKPSLTPAQAAEVRERAARGEKKAALAREFGVSRETLYQHLNAAAK